MGMEAFICFSIMLVDNLFIAGIDVHSIIIFLDRAELTDDD